jgi:AraC family ethanolamine operon transcriptional activator
VNQDDRSSMITSKTTPVRDGVNTFCESQLFQDFDEWTKAFRNWNLTTTQLDRGKFKGELAIAQFGCLQFIYASTDKAIQIIGDKPPKAIIFATPLIQAGELIAHDRRLNQNVLFGLDPTRETRVISQKSCQVAIVSVSLDLFYLYTEQMQSNQFKDRFFQRNVIAIYPTKLDNFKTYLRQLLYLLRTNPTWLQQPQTQKLIVEDCLPLLIDTLQFDEKLSDSRIPTLQRYQMIKAMEDFLMTHIDRPLTLKDLYAAVKTSPRALSYGVQDLFAMSPMDYFKVKRLNGVRQSLKTCDPHLATVSGIAARWGFWSMGHFARDYKRLFGELPSETLKKRRR